MYVKSFCIQWESILLKKIQHEIGFTCNFWSYSGHSLLTDLFNGFNRKRVHTRERSLMLSATSSVIRLEDLYHQNLTVIMPMYVTSNKHCQLQYLSKIVLL